MANYFDQYDPSASTSQDEAVAAAVGDEYGAPSKNYFDQFDTKNPVQAPPHEPTWGDTTLGVAGGAIKPFFGFDQNLANLAAKIGVPFAQPMADKLKEDYDNLSTWGTPTGQTIGNVAGLIPLVARGGAGLVQLLTRGAVAGMTTPHDSPGELLTDMGTSAGTNVGLGKIAQIPTSVGSWLTNQRVNAANAANTAWQSAAAKLAPMSSYSRPEIENLLSTTNPYWTANRLSAAPEFQLRQAAAKLTGWQPPAPSTSSGLVSGLLSKAVNPWMGEAGIIATGDILSNIMSGHAGEPLSYLTNPHALGGAAATAALLNPRLNQALVRPTLQGLLQQYLNPSPSTAQQ